MVTGGDAVADLAFFVLLAKAGSLTAAARELGVTGPTVSKRLMALERRLGARLLNRTTRRVSLTAEGEAYGGEGGRLLAELNMLEQRIAGARAVPRGLLRVHAPLGFGRHYLAPAVSAFLRAYPEVEVQLNLSERPVHMGDDFDVAVHVGALPDSQLSLRKIASNRRLLCAAPAYLRGAGEPTQPAELRRHQCIVIRENDEAHGVWQFQQQHKAQSVKVGGKASTNDGETALLLALDGHGIVLRSEWHVAPYLRSGRLQQLLPDWQSAAADVVAVYPASQNLSARTRVFVDFLVARFQPYLGAGADGLAAARW